MKDLKINVISDRLTIQKATQEDVEQIFSIELENYKFFWDKEYILFNINLSEEIKKFYVAKLENKVIGYIVCWLSEKTAHIHNISVKKEYQNFGVGSKLLEHLLYELLNLNINTVILEVRVSNHKAISLYKKFGFSELEIKKGFYPDNEDAILMIKNLNNERREICNYTASV